MEAPQVGRLWCGDIAKLCLLLALGGKSLRKISFLINLGFGGEEPQATSSLRNFPSLKKILDY